MKKYLQVFKISFRKEFVYRVNFVMWRVRNILQIFMVFFLWDSIFYNEDRVLFGYSRDKILTYIFGLLVVRAFVLSSRAQDVIGEVANGELSNYLIKPVNYFKYWFTRDISSKALNLVFAFFETAILFLILRPPFFLQKNPLILLAFVVSVSLSILIYFILNFLVGALPFWVPEAAWGFHFLFLYIIVEFLSGSLFPLDVLPSAIQNVINFTPFPYLIFFPIQVYLGNVSGLPILRGIGISFAWVIVLWYLMKSLWNRGLKAYQAYGK